MNEPIAYCVDLEEDALFKASKILGLEPTDVNFLNTPLYTHLIHELSDDEIKEIIEKHSRSSRRELVVEIIAELHKKAS